MMTTTTNEHVLSDGTRIEVRPIRPEDKHALREAFRRLSPESRYRRFLSEKPELTDEMLRYLTEVDGKDHVALVAVLSSLDLKEECGVGVARFIRVPSLPDVAEAAVTVVDDMQRRGVGRALLEELTRRAREAGIRTFRGELLAENEPMRRLLEEVGADVRREGEGILVFDVSIEEHRAIPDALAMLLRFFASQAVSFFRAPTSRARPPEKR